jgi:hypothetical protein
MVDLRRQREAVDHDPPDRTCRAARSQLQGFGRAGDESHRSVPGRRHHQQPTRIPVSRLFPELETLAQLDDKVYFGGPVEIQAVSFLFRFDKPPEKATEVLDGLYFSTDRELLRKLLGRDQPMEGLRIFVGFSGWARGQLEAEIARGDLDPRARRCEHDLRLQVATALAGAAGTGRCPRHLARDFSVARHGSRGRSNSLRGRPARPLRFGRLRTGAGERASDASPRVAQHRIRVIAAHRARFLLDLEVIVRRPETAVRGIVIAVHTHILAAAHRCQPLPLVQQ